MSAEPLSGAEIVIRALVDQGVDVVFGYPGGAVLPIYDALFKQNSLRHILVRQEGGAVHAAEGYARSTGRGRRGAGDERTGRDKRRHRAHRRADGLGPDRLPDGPGADASDRQRRFQEADTTGITRPCTKHNYLGQGRGRIGARAARGLLRRRERPARAGRRRSAQGYPVRAWPLQPAGRRAITRATARSCSRDPARIAEAVELIGAAKRPLFYGGGGLINSGPEACARFAELVRLTDAPCTSTLMGLGAFPAADPHFLGMVGMHGTYEANMAMHDCDLMIAVGSRFDDRVTGRLNAFSPGSKKIHIDIDPSSINKNVRVDLPIIGDVG